MKVLAIGNSFSQDATRYLHSIAKCGGDDITVVNLYIGGCPLSRHYRNMLSKEKAYALDFNGQSTGFHVNLDEALLSRDWDYITLQQASALSINYDTYQPYLEDLSSYVRMCSPKAKLIIHETWSYEDGCEKLKNLGYDKRCDMYDALHKAYDFAASATAAYSVIPSGTLFEKLAKCGLPIHRDTAHASWGIGRYALSLLWYACLTGKNVSDNSFADFDEDISPDNVAIIKKCVNEIAR
ncbi:MAG: DUF4886 domain-containing protein [Ruminococcaceae bacterium]|nr:DUF4886 domain-containing protein [Oscillospiraceae bacterium]